MFCPECGEKLQWHISKKHAGCWRCPGCKRHYPAKVIHKDFFKKKVVGNEQTKGDGIDNVAPR